MSTKSNSAFLLQHNDQLVALDKLRHTVRSLTHARHRQLLVDYLYKGLFAGLLLACVAILLLRLNLIKFIYPTSLIIVAIIGLAIIIALLTAWRQRPDELQVAIVADVKLKLKQQLSTAWEFAANKTTAESPTNPVVVEQLALQAIKSRLPARADRIFPISLNAWAKLTPIAAGLLLLLLVFDVSQFSKSLTTDVDALVVSQGVQLRDYGRQMQSQARRENLLRSQQQAQQMQQLGRTMERGALSRQQALQQLQKLATTLEQQRQAALTASTHQTIATSLNADQLQTVAVQAGANQSNLQVTLNNLINGDMQATQLQFSASDEAALSRYGISLQDVQDAIDNLAAGDDENLRKILQTLSQNQQPTDQRDAQVLEQAQRKLDQVRENLGDTSTHIAAQSESPADSDASNSADEFGGQFGGAPMDVFPNSNDRSAAGLGSGYGPYGNQQNPATLATGSHNSGVVLKPESQIGDGKIFTSPVQVLPRNNQPQLDTAELAPEYAQQLETVLAKEHYPLHQKELIRRYFLTLSTGTDNVNPPQPARVDR